MPLNQDESSRKLAELKAYLEKRMSELNQESSTLSTFLEVIDSLLTEKSFRRVEISKDKIEYLKQPHPEQQRIFPEEEPILTTDGKQLGDIFVEGKSLTVIPSENMNFKIDSPPFKSFLLAKVLEPIKKKDIELCNEKKKEQSEAFTYNLEEENGILRSLIIHNFNDERRLLELKNAIRWTFRRMHEK